MTCPDIVTLSTTPKVLERAGMGLLTKWWLTMV